MNIIRCKQEDGTTLTTVASIPTEDVIVQSTVDYIPQFATDVFGQTTRVTKDVTTARLINILKCDFPEFDLVSIGTPVNFDVAPTHLTRVLIPLKTRDQVQECLKAIGASDLMIRSRIQPAWDWQMATVDGLRVMLHVGWYDTVYFMQFKDVFLGSLHCRYSAKFGFDPREAEMTHFRYTDSGDLEEVTDLNEKECHADSIKDQVEFLRVFRDGSVETT
jgi:hypothetical protein